MAEDGGAQGAQARASVFQFAYRRSADQDAGRPVRRPVVVVGAGPVGLTLAVDLAQRKPFGVAEHLGSDTFLHVQSDVGPLTVRGDGEIAARHGDTIYLTPDPSKLHRFGADGTAL